MSNHHFLRVNMTNIEYLKIAILIPCHNEELTIGKVIDDFHSQLPKAAIYVFDNCSTDATSAIAHEHGVTVMKEPRKGKGFAVESMFAFVKADYYIMVDGDDTYSAAHVKQLLEPVIASDADMAVGTRLSQYSDTSFRPLHVFGNNLVRRLVNWIGHTHLRDIMSGYRAFNARVVEKIPIGSSGFEIETELTIQMLYYRMKIVEVDIPYKERPPGSQSKLRTFQDGFRVLWKIFSLFRAFKPLTFFGGCGLLLLLLGGLAGILPIYEYFFATDHYINHVPLAILATGLTILSCLSVTLGLLLHAINWRFWELHNVLTRKQR
jgi:glycosyltransferase involved in cell wall biosynthesis